MEPRRDQQSRRGAGKPSPSVRGRGPGPRSGLPGGDGSHPQHGRRPDRTRSTRSRPPGRGRSTPSRRKSGAEIESRRAGALGILDEERQRAHVDRRQGYDAERKAREEELQKAQEEFQGALSQARTKREAIEGRAEHGRRGAQEAADEVKQGAAAAGAFNAAADLRPGRRRRGRADRPGDRGNRPPYPRASPPDAPDGPRLRRLRKGNPSCSSAQTACKAASGPRPVPPGCRDSSSGPTPPGGATPTPRSSSSPRINRCSKSPTRRRSAWTSAQATSPSPAGPISTAPPPPPASSARGPRATGTPATT